MSRDGQSVSDYGEHLFPEAEWANYSDCHRCPAKRGMPCLDMRYFKPEEFSVPKRCWKAHAGRPLVSVTDGSIVLERAGMAAYSRVSRNLEARRALNWVSLPSQNRTGRARWHQAAPCKSNGHYITVGYTDWPYGRSTHSSGYLTHIVGGILFAWQDGKLIEAQIRWRCNGRARNWVLLQEPNSVVCPVCKIERLPRERGEG